MAPEDAEIVNTSVLKPDDYKIINKIEAFIDKEAQACESLHSASGLEPSNLFDCSSNQKASSIISHGGKGEASTIDSLANDIDQLNPLKMRMFCNIIQHKVDFDSQKNSLNYFLPLVKSEALYRDIDALDRIHANETIKIAIIYVGPGQWTEAEILSNSLEDTSLSYRSFVSGLGWRIDLKKFTGFTGKLEADGSDGATCPYYSGQGLDVVFHEVVSMPTDTSDPRQIKK
ncbi:hypothetical protein GGF37_007231, partial [Kickxella alabastrina]